MGDQERKAKHSVDLGPEDTQKHSFYTEGTVAACSDPKGTGKISLPSTKLSIPGCHHPRWPSKVLPLKVKGIR